MAEMQHKCAVAAVFDPYERSSGLTVELLDAMQKQRNRGQLSWGVSLVRSGTFSVLHGMDDENPFKAKIQPTHNGIAHRRYATSGGNTLEGAHPILVENEAGIDPFSFAFNGQIANFQALAQELNGEGFHLDGTSDTQVLRALLIQGMRIYGREKLTEVFGYTQSRIDGSYNVVLQFADTLAAYRDTHGFRPLHYVERPDGVVGVASEDSALTNFGHKIHTLAPGSMLLAKLRKRLEVLNVQAEQPSHCYFEWVYFMNWLSSFEGVEASEVRKKLGAELARMDGDLLQTGSFTVVPVPESAILAGDGYTEASGLPQNNRVLQKVMDKRGFTTSSKDRAQVVREKYTIEPNGFVGQKIVLVDDSVVRGDTMRELVKRLRTEAGAAEIHLRLTAPPILAPCFYGIDMKTVHELIARKYHNQPLKNGVLPADVLQALAEDLGVDSICFVPVEAVPQAIGITRDKLCMACVTAEYPTSEGERLYQLGVPKPAA
jgi:amidophosphoribosyltransferase